MAVDVQVGDDRVEVRFTGLDRVWCLSSGFDVAMADVLSARVTPTGEVRRDLGWRLGGTAWPGSITAGRFSVKGRPHARQFWDVRRADEVLVIETRQQRPARIVLEHPARHDLAWWIGERLPAA